MGLNLEQEKVSLAKRATDAHKGDFGHVCILGGGHAGYAGAVALAGQAALRSGAGLVSAVVNTHALGRMNSAPDELMCYPLEAAEDLNSLFKKITVGVVGSGMSQSAWALELFNRVLEEALFNPGVPLVIDADGLNILATHPTSVKRDNWILTPHVGEAARLLGVSTQAIQENRIEAIKQLQEKWGGVIVLKGAGTLVYTKGEPLVKCEQGNPGMSTGGMGDVLAGLIGGLVAQGLGLYSAAKLGVIVHAVAADNQKAQGERGLLASDLFSEFRKLLN